MFGNLMTLEHESPVGLTTAVSIRQAHCKPVCGFDFSINSPINQYINKNAME